MVVDSIQGLQENIHYVCSKSLLNQKRYKTEMFYAGDLREAIQIKTIYAKTMLYGDANSSKIHINYSVRI